MTLAEKDNVLVVSSNASEMAQYVDTLNATCDGSFHKHIIADIRMLKKVKKTDLKQLVLIAKRHKKSGKSFVVLLEGLPFADTPSTLTVVPTLKEAYDIIEIEDIERDMGIS